MSILHRRKHNRERCPKGGACAIPGWAELVKLDESEATALARVYGLDDSSRHAALSALNDYRKARA